MAQQDKRGDEVISWGKLQLASLGLVWASLYKDAVANYVCRCSVDS